MSVDYKPDYTDRDTYYANKDRAVAEREKEIAEGGPKPRAQPKAHDYRQGRWGHTANVLEVIDGGQKLKMYGFGTGIRPGDFIIKGHSSGAVAPYQVDEVRYERDPPDMWFVSATFRPEVFGVTEGGEIFKLPPKDEQVE